MRGRAQSNPANLVFVACVTEPVAMSCSVTAWTLRQLSHQDQCLGQIAQLGHAAIRTCLAKLASVAYWARKSFLSLMAFSASLSLRSASVILRLSASILAEKVSASSASRATAGSEPMLKSSSSKPVVESSAILLLNSLFSPRAFSSSPLSICTVHQGMRNS